MHSFKDLELKTLKKICSKYNLHIKIARYSKLSKEELIPHMEKHLHINSEGKIKMKKEASEMAESELNKLIHELKNKVKEVKEKVVKIHAKKAKKEIHIEEKKEDKIINFLKNQGFKEKKEEKKEKKTVEQMKEEEILKAIPLYLKLDDYKGVEVNQKMQEMVNEMDQFPSVASALQGIEEYLKKHPELNKTKPKKEMKKEEKPATEAQKKEMEDIYKMMKPKKEIQIEEKEEEDNIDKLFNKLTQKIFITPIEKIKEALLKLNYKGKMQTNKMLLNIQLSKEFNTNEKIKKLLNELEEKTPMDKIEKIQNELNKLEQIIKIDEKQNEKEHKQLKKPKHDNDSDEEYNAMKPKKASDVLILKVSEVKDLAKKHNISLKHKVNNKEVAKGGPMLKKEIIKYLKL